MKQILIAIFIGMFMVGIVSAAPNTVYSFQDFESGYAEWTTDSRSSSYAYSGSNSFQWGYTKEHPLDLSPFNESDWINISFYYYATNTNQQRIQIYTDASQVVMLRTYGGNWEYLTVGPFVQITPHCLTTWCKMDIVIDRITGTVYYYHNGALAASYTGTASGNPISDFMAPLDKINSGFLAYNLYLDDFTLSYEPDNTAPEITGGTTVQDDIQKAELFTFEITVTDLDFDTINYEWSVDGTVVSTDESFLFDGGIYDSGVHIVEVEISDGIATDIASWTVDVRAKGGEASDKITGMVTKKASSENVVIISEMQKEMNIWERFMNWLRGIFK